eukprot:gene13682-13804_t
MAEPERELSNGDIEAQDVHASSSKQIDIFLRVKPVLKPTDRITLDNLESTVAFNIPRDSAAGLINNSKERYQFSFNGLLSPDAKQDEVFERVARPVVVSALEGFNGTIFAYGQTGSGKTFTITGGAERYIDRGIIPRTITCIYAELAKHTNYTFQVHVSYLEIYNETGLVAAARVFSTAMHSKMQVYIQEDEEQNIHFKHLSVHRAASEEEALNLLFLGDTNRTISETPMNQASSRSHCIFTIMLEARRPGSDLVRRSKLNLVDLAGSERVAKTGVDGTILKEAKYINLSLHYLEQVIVALQERSMGLARGHVPYRNSLMTLVLRDSLGGNCRTVMVATISGEVQSMEESISTCRFAQRVALVKNEVSVNEEVDPSAVIRRLRQEVRDLKEELKLLKGEGPVRGPLTEDEIERLKLQLLAFVADEAQDSSLNLGGDMLMIRAGWQVFKQLLRQTRHPEASAGSSNALQSAGGSRSGSSSQSSDLTTDGGGKAMQEQIRKLKLQVQQRDNEIAIMAIEDNKHLLKAKYNQAKALATAVNASKGKMQELKAQIEHWRMQRSAACVVEGTDPVAALASDEPREQQAKQQIEQEKASYKASFSQLRELKSEIEQLQMLLEQSSNSNRHLARPSSMEDTIVTPGSSSNRVAGAAASVSGGGEGAGVASITSSKVGGTNTGSFDISKVDAAVLEAALPHLTGNPTADEDIVRFFEARAKLLHKAGK